MSSLGSDVNLSLKFTGTGGRRENASLTDQPLAHAAAPPRTMQPCSPVLDEDSAERPIRLVDGGLKAPPEKALELALPCPAPSDQRLGEPREIARGSVQFPEVSCGSPGSSAHPGQPERAGDILAPGRAGDAGVPPPGFVICSTIGDAEGRDVGLVLPIRKIEVEGNRRLMGVGTVNHIFTRCAEVAFPGSGRVTGKRYTGCHTFVVERVIPITEFAGGCSRRSRRSIDTSGEDEVIWVTVY